MKAILHQKIYYSKHIKKNLPSIFVTFPPTAKVNVFSYEKLKKIKDRKSVLLQKSDRAPRILL